MARYIVLLLLLALTGCARASAERPDPAAGAGVPTRLILLIGDGAGTAFWSAAHFAAGPLAVARAEEIGLVDTRNVFGRITDSAAGATSFATGVLTFNGAIGVGPDSLPRPTILELAEARGMATGLVATSSLTHATPASFAAHVPSRTQNPEIAAQMAEQGIEVLLGGGRGFFDGSLRPDGRNLLGGLDRRYTIVQDPAALRALALDTVGALLGLFAENNPGGYAERGFELADLTRAALTILDRDDDGFFLMVEGAQPDWRGHDNRPLGEVVDEMLDFDRAVGVALDYARRTPGTLVVITADHETGGLAVEQDDSAFTAGYTTIGHTAELVPLFASGPGAERFGEILDIARVGRLLIGHIAADGAVAPPEPAGHRP